MSYGKITFMKETRIMKENVGCLICSVKKKSELQQLNRELKFVCISTDLHVSNFDETVIDNYISGQADDYCIKIDIYL